MASEYRAASIFTILPGWLLSPFSLNPTPIISMAINAFAFPITPVNEVMGAGSPTWRSDSTVIIRYASKGMDLSSVFITGNMLNLAFFSFVATAAL